MSARVTPIEIAGSSPAKDPRNAATIIFMHGLGDDGAAFENLAQQFHSAGKLPHLNWVFPTALENRDLMMTAWFYPTPLTPFPSQRPELDDPEDEDGMLQTVKYISSVIEDQVAKGVPLNRIVLGGFSQGCAISLLMHLTTRYAGKLAGICGLSGFMPLSDRLIEMRKDADLGPEIGKVPVFYSRGSRDMLVPKRYYRMGLEKLHEMGVKDDVVEAHEYEGLGHMLSGVVIRDVCTWLEKVVPAIES